MCEEATRSPRGLLGAVFVLYVAAVSFTAWHHEPWFDEAQAWLIARDSGLIELLTDRLRYEGSPGLWHLLLAVPAKLGLPYRTISLISVTLAIATVFLFLRYSPFTWHVKALFPFGFFTIYQYAVVARSYVLMALVLVALAAVYHRRNERPVLWFFLLGLLANVNVHGFFIAGFLAAYHLVQLAIHRRQLPARTLRAHGVGAVVLGSIAVLEILQLLPPDDLSFPADSTNFRCMILLALPFTPRVVSSIPVLAFSAFLFWRRRLLLVWLGPTAAVLWIFVFKTASCWHEGIIYYYWVFCLWIALDAPPRAADRPPDAAAGQLAMAANVMMILVLAVQVYWGMICAARDVLYAYSGSQAASRYLAEHRLTDREIYACGYSTVSLLPYFPENIFDNYHGKRNPSYYLWAEGNALARPFDHARRQRPEFILVGVKTPRTKPQRTTGYTLRRRFLGALYWKDGFLEADSFYLYQRIDLAGPNHPERDQTALAGPHKPLE